MTTSKGKQIVLETIILPKVPGRLERFEFASHRVDVYVPNDLNTKTPVLAMHDGHNLFLSKHTTFGATWGLLEALTPRKIGGTRIHGSPLIIGVWQKEQTTSMRVSELSPTDFFKENPKAVMRIDPRMIPDGYSPLGNDYQKLIAKTILPGLAEHYGIELKRERTAIAGSSMGGLASLYAIGKYPTVYGTALAFSTHWPIGGNALVDYLVAKLPSPARNRVWSDTGTIELDADYGPFHARFTKKMKARGFEHLKNFVAAEYPMTGHSELWWAGRVEHPINWWLEG